MPQNMALTCKLFEFRWNKLLQRHLADRRVHEQFQPTAKPQNHGLPPPDGIPRLLL